MCARTPIRWIVTAGPTCEDIDPVRFISNRSSGTMGYALAEAASARGDDVELISGPVALTPPPGCLPTHVRTTRQMYEAVLERFDGTDVVVMAAAVADFRPRRRAERKMKKLGGTITLELEPTEDILAELGRRKRSQILVGFALESPDDPAETGADRATDSMRENARRKLEEKNLDLVALNGPAAIGAAVSALSVLQRDRTWTELGNAPKDAHARAIVDIAARLAERR
jgi:phosphopantothenoylcysteine decarboxylase/phosphopantothenate--cysteine ligase